MSNQSPRIYVYKITFKEVPHYYYGVHKEKKFNEDYFGSPVTHKNYWELYTPIKEYIKFFEFNDEGFKQARIFENSLIGPALNEELCLNAHCGGGMSLKVYKTSGKLGGLVNYLRGNGIHALSKEQKIENASKAGKKSFELGVGVHARSSEKMTEDGIKGGTLLHKLGLGIHSMTKEEKSEAGKIGGMIAGRKTYELGLGVHSLSEEEKNQARKKAAKTQHAQRWECTVTGHVSSPCGLSSYQRARGIDTTNRKRIK